MIFKAIRFSPYFFLLITIASIDFLSPIVVNTYFVWWIINVIILTSLFNVKKHPTDIDKNVRFVRWILIWNSICILRGAFVADNYWEWKFLISTGMVLLIPGFIYVSVNKELVQKILVVWLKYALPAFLVFFPFFKYSDASGRYLVPISFLLLFFPVLPKKWKFITVMFSLFVFLGALGARSNIIKFSIPLFFSLLYYFHNTISKKIIQYSRILIILAPFCFFLLAASGIFNIFKMDEYIAHDLTTKVIVKGETKDENLMADTRTGIYDEVIKSAFKHNYVLFGRTPARGYESPSFGLYSLEKLKTGNMERFINEVSILNIFTWTGVIGVVLYFLIFYRATHLAVNRSNNTLIRIMGLYVSFRWSYAWVEDFTNFDISYFFLWLMIGMCFSKSFREMDNAGMKYWILGIFDKKYRPLQKATHNSVISQFNINEDNSHINYLPQP